MNYNLGFADCESMTEVVYQAVGAASTAWENFSNGTVNTGVFQDDYARAIAEQTLAEFRRRLSAGEVI